MFSLLSWNETLLTSGIGEIEPENPNFRPQMISSSLQLNVLTHEEPNSMETIVSRLHPVPGEILCTMQTLDRSSDVVHNRQQLAAL